MNPYLGEIRIFAGNFAPQGWALCNGQTLAISQNTALFSLLGTYYGGNGQTTFALPNLQGSVPVHGGQGPGLPPYALGQTGGASSITLNTGNLPAHTHPLLANASTGTQASPASAAIAEANTGTAREPAVAMGFTSAAANTTMAPTSIGAVGGAQPIAAMPPYLALNFIIAIQGIYPSRN